LTILKQINNLIVDLCQSLNTDTNADSQNMSW
jgi:hypothetical protein